MERVGSPRPGSQDDDETRRLAALHQLAVLDTEADPRFARVVRIAQRIFDVPTVSVNLIDAERQWSFAGLGMPERSVPRAEGLCDTTMRGGVALVVEDASRDPRFAKLPMVAGDVHLRFYAGAPLTAPGGEAVGALCIADTEPRRLTSAQLAVLEDLAAWVEEELARERELLDAAEILRLIQPRRTPALSGFTVAGSAIAARRVGGDFYDWYTLSDGSLQCLVGDVMGKGVPAALIASSVRAVMRGASRFNPLDEAVTRSGFSLQWDLEETGTFVTLFATRLQPETAQLEYVDAGHGLAVVVGSDGGFRQLVSDGLPLGALNDETWRSATTFLAPGEALVVASDGYLDAWGSLAACLERVQQSLGETDDAASMVERLSAQTLALGVPEDDLTLVVLRRDDA